MVRNALFALVTLVVAAPAWAINGNSLPLNSGGTTGTAALLNNNGYAGTYVTLDTAGPLTITVNAQGTNDGGADPHMNIVVGDEIYGWNVGPAAIDYERTFNLPAGTHFIRTEFNNDRNTARALRINTLEVSGTGVTIQPFNADVLARAAADTYIDNFRQGAKKLALSGLAPGTVVDVKLKRHAFNFGVGIPNSFTDTFLVPPDSPGADPGAAQFQQALVDNHFNSLTAGNAGKWDATEGSRDVVTTKQPPAYAAPYVYMDRIAQFADDNNMGYRSHNLIWGQNAGSGANNQQPGWVHTMLQNINGTDTYNAITNPHGTGFSNKDALYSDLVVPDGLPNEHEKSEINERIDYYVRDRAQDFYEIDVYNESYHTGENNPNSSNTYWDHYGATGIAKMYKQVNDAVALGGGNAPAMVNEYSVFQQEGGDYYANWYMRHIDKIQDAGKDLYMDENLKVVTGIGIQYYAGSNIANHNTSRIYADLQNLAVQGVPMSLTEFGVTGTDNPTNEATAATILGDTLRLVFGMAGTTGFTQWDLRNSGAFAPVGTFYDANWAIRDPAIKWQELQDEWDTDLQNLVVAADGTIDFTGFYGEYDITIGDETYTLDLTKGDLLSTIVVAPGDFNGDLLVDGLDYTVWRNSLETPGDLRADGNGDEVVDELDFDVWKLNYGVDYTPLPGGGGLAGVPEPAGAMLFMLGVAMFAGGRRRK